MLESGTKPRVGFIGAGTVGTALAVQLSEAQYLVVAVASRTRASSEKLAAMVSEVQVLDSSQDAVDLAELVFITTPDDVIAGVAANLNWHEGQAVIHCSGAASVDILEPARQSGALVGGFHPLQSFASVAKAIDNLPGSVFALEAEEPLLGILQEMALALRGRWVRLGPGDKVLYHAAAVIACNYLVTLMGMATDLWSGFGVSTKDATQALLPLVQGTVNNLRDVGLPNCLTGPIARGDLGTIRKHLEALEKSAPNLLAAYKELGLQTIPIALAKGKIDSQRAEELRYLLNT